MNNSLNIKTITVGVAYPELISCILNQSTTIQIRHSIHITHARQYPSSQQYYPSPITSPIPNCIHIMEGRGDPSNPLNNPPLVWDHQPPPLEAIPPAKMFGTQK